MAAQELDSAASRECKFPNVRRTYWRSATWVSRSAPPSPKGEGGGGGGDRAGTEPLLQRQGSKARASLPPLAIARRSLDEWPRAGPDDMADWTTPATPGRRGPDIKLDLASVHRASLEPTEIQLKREKIAFFDKECSRVANYHIYLGSDAVAKNRETLRANGITHVLNCVGFVCPEYFKKDLVYKTLWLQDSPWEDITSLLYDVFDYFEEVREQGGRVFVHCCQGVSRSASLVIAYLMWREHLSFEDAFQDVKVARGVTNPNMGFACQLLQCQKRVHAAPMSPNSVLRMYRMAPHSPYDPLHLVPKVVNNPGAGALDSRGAFVLHVPLAIYVWIGLHCDPKIAHAAKVAANQVVRYESAKGPVWVYAEGQEEAGFWDSLSKPAATPNEVDREGEQRANTEDREKLRSGHYLAEKERGVGVGNRKVPAYDVDFELYQRARQGGVVPPVPSTGGGVTPVPTLIPAREDGWSRLRQKFLSGELFNPKEIDGSPHSSPSSIAGSSHSSSDSPLSDVINPSQNRLQTLTPFSSQAALSPNTVCTESPIASHGASSPSGSDAQSTISVQADSSPDQSPNYSLCSMQCVPLSPSTVSANSLQSVTTMKPCLYGPCGHEQQAFPCNLRPLPPNLAGKSPAILLGQRRGTITPPLLQRCLEDEPPPAPRGMSRKPKLPPLVTVDLVDKAKLEKDMGENKIQDTGLAGLDDLSEDPANELLDHDMPDVSFVDRHIDDHIEGPSVQSTMVQDMAVTTAAPSPRDLHIDCPFLGAASSSGSRWSEAPCSLPVLYSWPQMERIDMFDADDLNSKTVFILVGPQDGVHGPTNVIYVWVGKEQVAYKEQQDTMSDVVWEQVGQQFLVQMKCPMDVRLRVVREGFEPDDFWENFSNG